MRSEEFYARVSRNFPFSLFLDIWIIEKKTKASEGIKDDEVEESYIVREMAHENQKGRKKIAK